MATLSPERRAALEKEKAKHHTGGAFFKMTGTKAVIRLLPLSAAEEIGTKVTQHFIANKGYTCPMGTHGRPGVIDTATRALRKIGDAESMEIADGLDENRNTKYCLKIIDRANPSAPVLYRAPYGVYKVVFEAFYTDGEDLADINEGCDIRISKEGSGKGTKYDVRVLKPSPLVADEDGNPMKKAIKELVAASENMHTADLARTDEQGALEALADNLPKHLWKQIKAEVSAVLSGAAGEDEAEGDEDADSEDEDEKPAPKKKAAAKVDDDDEEPVKPVKKKAAPVIDEDADADDADDEDDAPPAKKPASKKTAPVVEDDEDEEPVKPVKKAAAKVEEDDEDEETVKPAPKKKTAPVIDEDDDEEPVKPAPKKKTAPVVEEDDEDEEPVAKKPATRFKPRA